MARRRRNRQDDILTELPWQLELWTWVVGLLVGLGFAGAVLWNVTAPARWFEETMGIHVDIIPILNEAWFYALVVGVISMLSAQRSVRRWFLRLIPS